MIIAIGLVTAGANGASMVTARRRWAMSRQRRGQSLVEFALVALVLYLVFAAIIEFGRTLFVAQVAQSAADLAAREIARTPLPANWTFEKVLEAPDQNNPADPRHLAHSVYSEDYLAIVVEQNNPLPGVNRSLLPLMMISRVGNVTLLRYPGALVTSSTAPSGFTVMIPVVLSRDGGETIRWVRVIEDIQAGEPEQPPDDDPADPFNVVSPERGLVALRINYPFQAATMSSFQPNPAGPFEPSVGIHIADDGSVIESNAVPNGGTLVAPDPQGGDYGGTYGGAYGLGEHGALNSPQLASGFPLRPYRRVISVNAMALREVFYAPE
jgi:hypothetical protein